VDDPERVKAIIQSTAMLEIKQSLGGPYPSEQAAMQAQQTPGVIPSDAILLPGTRARQSEGQAWYLVSRVSAVSGKDLPDASPAAIRTVSRRDLHLSGEGGRRFYNFTSAHVGESLAVVLDTKCRKWRTFARRSATRDQSAVAA